jgi:hypothetical protein
MHPVNGCIRLRSSLNVTLALGVGDVAQQPPADHMGGIRHRAIDMNLSRRRDAMPAESEAAAEGGA